MPRDRDKNNQWHRDYYRNNRDTINARRKELYHSNPDKKARRQEKDRAAYQDRKEGITRRTKEYRLRLKTQMVEAYGGKCTCCGESEICFLTVEHLNKDGKKHREELGNSWAVYRDLKERGYPKDYTVLCFNCNIAKSLYGSCPHQLSIPEKSFRT